MDYAPGTLVPKIGLLNIALFSLRRQRAMAAFLRHIFDIHLSPRKPLHGITVCEARNRTSSYAVVSRHGVRLLSKGRTLLVLEENLCNQATLQSPISLLFHH